MNMKYSFENFYLNMNNKQAFFAARDVAQNPGKSTNPLYIYGGSQTGKTHILYSIEQFVKGNHPDLNVIHVTCMTFIDDVIDALRTGFSNPDHFRAFKEKYEMADVLLFDDIDALAGKQSTQEEFLSIFNVLFESGKQIVLTGSRSPRDFLCDEKMKKSESIISRLEWGRVVEIPSNLYPPEG